MTAQDVSTPHRKSVLAATHAQHATLSYVHREHEAWPNTAMNSNIRVGVDGSMGAWPGDNQYNCVDGYNCPDPSLKLLGRYDGDQKRRVWVSAGDSKKFAFSATSNISWLRVSHRLATVDSRKASNNNNSSSSSREKMERLTWVGEIMEEEGAKRLERRGDGGFEAGGGGVILKKR